MGAADYARQGRAVRAAQTRLTNLTMAGLRAGHPTFYHAARSWMAGSSPAMVRRLLGLIRLAEPVAVVGHHHLAVLEDVQVDGMSFIRRHGEHGLAVFGDVRLGRVQVGDHDLV